MAVTVGTVNIGPRWIGTLPTPVKAIKSIHVGLLRFDYCSLWMHRIVVLADYFLHARKLVAIVLNNTARNRLKFWRCDNISGNYG